MLGGQVGSLSAIVYDNGLPDASWIVTGNQGSAWHRGSLLLGPRYAGQYYVSLAKAVFVASIRRQK